MDHFFHSNSDLLFILISFNFGYCFAKKHFTTPIYGSLLFFYIISRILSMFKIDNNFKHYCILIISTGYIMYNIVFLLHLWKNRNAKI